MAMQRLLLTQAEISTLVAAILDRRERLAYIMEHGTEHTLVDMRQLCAEHTECTDILRRLREMQPIW